MSSVNGFDIDLRGLYFLIRNDRIVYVGSAANHGPFSNVWRRVTEHRRRGEKKFDSFMVFGRMDKTPEEIRKEEVDLIRRHRPEYNIQHRDFVALDPDDYVPEFTKTIPQKCRPRDDGRFGIVNDNR